MPLTAEQKQGIVSTFEGLKRAIADGDSQLTATKMRDLLRDYHGQGVALLIKGSGLTGGRLMEWASDMEAVLRVEFSGQQWSLTAGDGTD